MCGEYTYTHNNTITNTNTNTTTATTGTGHSIVQHKSLLEDVKYRIEQRVQRRLVIITAKPAPNNDKDDSNDEEAIKKHYNQAKYQVLQNPILSKLICHYIDYDYAAQSDEKLK